MLLSHGMLIREGGSESPPRDSSALSLPEPRGAGRRQAFGAIKPKSLPFEQHQPASINAISDGVIRECACAAYRSTSMHSTAQSTAEPNAAGGLQDAASTAAQPLLSWLCRNKHHPPRGSQLRPRALAQSSVKARGAQPGSAGRPILSPCNYQQVIIILSFAPKAKYLHYLLSTARLLCLMQLEDRTLWQSWHLK